MCKGMAAYMVGEWLHRVSHAPPAHSALGALVPVQVPVLTCSIGRGQGNGEGHTHQSAFCDLGARHLRWEGVRHHDNAHCLHWGCGCM